MDIKITHSLLTQFLKTNAQSEQIAEKLSLCGPTVDRLSKLPNDDWLYEIEIITNRVDVASAFGVAREAVAILPEFGFSAKLINDPRQLTLPKLPSNQPVTVTIDQKLCPRFTCVAMDNVTIKPSPQKTLDLLELTGERGLNNVIDISNELTVMYGQPVHIFDLDRIRGQQILLRRSKKGESIETLDGKIHNLSDDDIVIEDGDGRLIDLCGIMGGNLSSVTTETKRVLIFVQTYEPHHIRKTSLALQKRTLAAQLFEKSPDPEMVLPVLLKGIDLLRKRANAEVSSSILDLYPDQYKPKSISLSKSWLNQFTGVNLDLHQIINILKRLDIKSTNKNDILTCVIPSHRSNDLNIQEDLAEEIMRVYGYFRLPSIIPKTDLPAIPTSKTLKLETKIKHILVNLGATEIYSYSLVSKKMIGSDQNTSFKLKNPLSEDYLYMRQQLLPSLLEVRKNNKGSFDKPYTLFEIANVYTKSTKDSLALESTHLSIIWNMIEYRQAKGLCQTLASKLNLPDKLLVPQIIDNTFGLEINLDELMDRIDTTHHFKPLPTTQAIVEDLTFTVIKQNFAQIADQIVHTNPLIESVDLKAIYHQNYTFTITYRSKDHTLSSQEITPLRKKIVETLEANGHKLVGKLSD